MVVDVVKVVVVIEVLNLFNYYNIYNYFNYLLTNKSKLPRPFPNRNSQKINFYLVFYSV